MGAPPPLVGYNTNVRHKGKLFHIQTEDSGITKPHVITHLFADGGRVVATRKTTYAEQVAVPDREDVVRRIMKDQHKAMFVALRDGVYDESDAAKVAAAAAANAAAAPRPEDGFAPTPHSGVVTGFDPNVAAEGIPTPVDPSVIPPPPDSAPAVAVPHAAAPRVAPPVAPAAAPVRVAPRSAPPPVRPAQSTSAAIAAARARRSAPPPPPPPSRSAPPAAPNRPASALGPAASPARPAPQARPPGAPAPKSIFGQDLISEKSLDEVILSYLSRELDEK